MRGVGLCMRQLPTRTPFPSLAPTQPRSCALLCRTADRVDGRPARPAAPRKEATSGPHAPSRGRHVARAAGSSQSQSGHITIPELKPSRLAGVPSCPAL
eukprot:scaffold3464_cov406-Prasinococcus_capsulatus_cf.AAC.6